MTPKRSRSTAVEKIQPVERVLERAKRSATSHIKLISLTTQRLFLSTTPVLDETLDDLLDVFEIGRSALRCSKAGILDGRSTAGRDGKRTGLRLITGHSDLSFLHEREGRHIVVARASDWPVRAHDAWRDVRLGEKKPPRLQLKIFLVGALTASFMSEHLADQVIGMMQ